MQEQLPSIETRERDKRWSFFRLSWEFHSKTDLIQDPNYRDFHWLFPKEWFRLRLKDPFGAKFDHQNMLIKTFLKEVIQFLLSPFIFSKSKKLSQDVTTVGENELNLILLVRVHPESYCIYIFLIKEKRNWIEEHCTKNIHIQ